VIDSVPEAEYQETLDKVSGLVRAVNIVEKGSIYG
jgi:anthranilate/para-aminobenzoate synthase component I